MYSKTWLYRCLDVAISWIYRSKFGNLHGIFLGATPPNPRSRFARFLTALGRPSSEARTGVWGEPPGKRAWPRLGGDRYSQVFSAVCILFLLVTIRQLSTEYNGPNYIHIVVSFLSCLWLRHHAGLFFYPFNLHSFYLQPTLFLSYLHSFYPSYLHPLSLSFSQISTSIPSVCVGCAVSPPGVRQGAARDHRLSHLASARGGGFLRSGVSVGRLGRGRGGVADGGGHGRDGRRSGRGAELYRLLVRALARSGADAPSGPS